MALPLGTTGSLGPAFAPARLVRLAVKRASALTLDARFPTVLSPPSTPCATVSPGLSRRQRPSRYAIRAGRNLPDKEFRYLRTVIVTAAVYRGFGSELRLAANPSP